MRRVKVFWWQGNERVLVGELAQARVQQEIVFEWNQEFLLTKVELSPLRFKKVSGLINCPKEPFEGLPGLFADHVPDGWGRVLLRHGFRERGLNLNEASPLDMLSYIGDRGMGALSFEPALKPTESWANGKVSLDKLNAEIEPILSGTPSAVIEEFLSGGASPNGARPKIIIKEKNGQFFVGNEDLKLDEWLVKFRAPGDSPDIGKVEFLYSQLARQAGLNVPETRLFETKKGAYFAVKRFDRLSGERVHVHTLSGILQASPVNFSTSYEHFAQVTNFLTKDIREFENVLRIAAFNVFACNRDDHSKNVAFLMSKEGAWQVAPAYDLTFFQGQFKEHKMSLNNKGLPQEADLLDFAKTFGLSTVKAKNIIEEVKQSVSRFPKLAKELDIATFERNQIQKALESCLASKKSKSLER